MLTKAGKPAPAPFVVRLLCGPMTSSASCPRTWARLRSGHLAAASSSHLHRPTRRVASKCKPKT